MTDTNKPYRTTRPVRHDGRRYDAGTPIALPDRHAQPLLLCGAIVADEAEPAAPAVPEGEGQHEIQPSAGSADGSSGAGVVAAATAPDAVSGPDAHVSSNQANANPPAGGTATADAGSHNPESESGKPEAPQASPAAPKVMDAKRRSAK